MSLFDKFKSEKSNGGPIPDTKANDNAEEELDTRGRDAITEAFEKLYPGQDDPLHNKEITVSEIAEKIGSDMTDYTRASALKENLLK